MGKRKAQFTAMIIGIAMALVSMGLPVYAEESENSITIESELSEGDSEAESVFVELQATETIGEETESIEESESIKETEFRKET